MAIQIAETREPFGALLTTNQATLAESAAYVRLCSELTRYVVGDISGRSFLISGHRGAGKTTLVLKAIEDTTFRTLNLRYRPLFVPLHGPDLLLPSHTNEGEEAPGEIASTGDEDGENNTSTEGAQENIRSVALERRTSTNGTNGKAVLQDSVTERDTQQFLRQVTIGIYRALADFFHGAYLRAVEVNAASGVPEWRGLFELAAQLRIELDAAPDVSLLREFWRRAGALDAGVIALAQYEGLPYPPGLTPMPTNYFVPPIPPSRGMLELVALSSSSQAYKRVSGKLRAKEGATQGITQKQDLAFETVGQVKNLLNPLLGALAGGAVGLALKSEVSPVLAALAGTATGLGAAVTLKYSSSRSRENTRSTEMTFLPDTTVASLDRVLPQLVSRCRQAGIAPVFVVDELDKVSNIEERMGPLVHHLKSLVTEKSFFCFLTDRSYLEGLRRQLVTTPYRAEYTYFSDRLFVLYAPYDLHQYLSKVLQLGSPSDNNDVVDWEVLPYVLLHRSRMHPFDLRRQLARLRTNQGTIALSPGAVRTELAYRFDVLIQVAVEWLLEQDALRERLTQDEDFTQLVYDTLYYPSRMWEQGSAEVDVSPKAFFEYLAERMSPSLGQDQQGQKSGKQREEKKLGENFALSSLDQDFLYTRLRELLAFLMNPARLRSDIEAANPKRFSINVLAAIPTDPKFKLLDFRDDKSRDVCVWRRDLFGRSIERLGVEVVLQEVIPRKLWIDSLQTELGKITPKITFDKLATDYNVLSATPAWNVVQQALRRLDRLRTDERPEPYAEMESDSTAVWEFSNMLQKSGVSLAQSLVAAKILGRVATAREGEKADKPEEQIIQAGLVVLGNRLSLKTLSAEDTAKKLRLVTAELKKAFPTIAFDEKLFSLAFVSPEEWANALRAALSQPSVAEITSSVAMGFTSNLLGKWRERFGEYFRNGTTEFEPVAADLICGAASASLSKLLTLNLNEVSLANWTELLLTAFTTPLTQEQVFITPDFGIPALFQLGFGKQISDAVTSGSLFQEKAIPRVSTLSEASPEIGDWVQSAAARKPLAPLPAALVVQDPANGPLDWKPSPKYAAVVVSKDDLPRLQQASQVITKPSTFSRLVVEVPPSPQVIARISSPPSEISSVYPAISKVPYSYFSRTSPSVIVISTYPFSNSPKTLDDAIDMASASTPQTAASNVP